MTQKLPMPPPLPAKTKSDRASQMAIAASVAAVAAVTPSAAAAAPSLTGSSLTAPPSPDAAASATTTAAGTLTGGWREIVRRDWRLLGGGVATGVILGVVVWLTLLALGSKSPKALAELKKQQLGEDATAAAPATDPPAAVEPAASTTPREAPSAATPNEASPDSEPSKETSAEAKSPVEAKPASVNPQPAAEPQPDERIAPVAASAQKEAAPASAKDIPPASQPATAVARSEPEDPKTAAASAEPATGEPAAKDALSDPATGDTNSTALAQIEMHLDDKVPSINFQDQSLREFLDVMSEYSTIPIGIDREALAKVNKGPLTPVRVRLADVTVAQALEAALSRHGLVTVVRGGKLIVTTEPAKP